MNSLTQPYAELEPSLILDAVESKGLLCTGSLLALNSYENRVYQVGIENETPMIAKFYRPNRWSDAIILEEHQFSHELADHEIPVIAPLVFEGQTLHHYKNYRFALFLRRGGRALELDNFLQLEWMGRFIGRLHAIGATRSYQHRPKLDINSHGHQPYAFLLKNDFIPTHIKPQYCETVDAILLTIETVFKKVQPAYIRIHGDCHAGNVLWRDEGPHIVDLDDSVMGPAMQDLWMLLSGNAHQVQAEMEWILEGYSEFHDFNRREMLLIEPLRTLRMIQYSAWLAHRWDDPAFPLAFPWFNTPAYWQEQLQNLNDQRDKLDSADY